MPQSIGRTIGLAVGLGALAMAGRRARRDHDAFYEWHGPRSHLLDRAGMPFALPLTTHRSEQVLSLHPVAFEPVRALMPSDRLHPLRLPDGRCLVALSAARYLETTADGMDPHDLPYAEAMIAVFVTTGSGQSMLPVLRSMLPGHGTPSFGAFMIHDAVSDRASRDRSRALGYPAFTADFAFEDGLAERFARVSEGGRDVFRLRAATRGRYSVDRRPMVVYNVSGERLMETVCPCSGIAQQAVGRSAGRLELGDHAIADQLRELEIAPAPLMTRSYLNLRLLVPAQRIVGPARAYVGYSGSDRARGSSTIEFPDGSVIDLAAAAATAPLLRPDLVPIAGQEGFGRRSGSQRPA